MAPDQRGQVREVVGADVHAIRPELPDGFLHVGGVLMDDGVQREAKGAELLFLPLPQRASDLAALAVVDAADIPGVLPAAVTQGG